MDSPSQESYLFQDAPKNAALGEKVAQGFGLLRSNAQNQSDPNQLESDDLALATGGTGASEQGSVRIDHLSRSMHAGTADRFGATVQAELSVHTMAGLALRLSRSMLVHVVSLNYTHRACDHERKKMERHGLPLIWVREP